MMHGTLWGEIQSLIIFPPNVMVRVNCKRRIGGYCAANQNPDTAVSILRRSRRPALYDTHLACADSRTPFVSSPLVLESKAKQEQPRPGERRQQRSTRKERGGSHVKDLPALRWRAGPRPHLHLAPGSRTAFHRPQSWASFGRVRGELLQETRAWFLRRRWGLVAEGLIGGGRGVRCSWRALVWCWRRCC